MTRRGIPLIRAATSFQFSSPKTSARDISITGDSVRRAPVLTSRRPSAAVAVYACRVSASGPTGTALCLVAPCAAALLRTVGKLYAERGLDISTTVAPELNARVRVEDLEEILGNLLDNACKWARTKVVLAGVSDGFELVLTAEDDGPGLPDSLRGVVMERGVRLDEAAPGSGLGLSIVRDLTEHYGGSIALADSRLGGLCVRISLPGRGRF